MRKSLMLAAAWLLPLSPAQAVPTLAGEDSSEDAISQAEYDAAVAQLRAELLEPGERVEGWNVGGADPDADLRALGADDHVFLTRTRDGTIVSLLSGRPVADLAPAEWRVVDRYGSPETPLPTPQVDFVPLSARYVFVSRTQFERRGDVDCSANITDAILYEIPDAPAGPGDADAAILFRMSIEALEDQEICVRSDGDAQSGYRGRSFLPDGRLLPALTFPDDVSTIVPAAPVGELLVYDPAPAAAEPDAS